ncbi:MAG: ankyrin repeat domain-containing protein [Fuerstiella sp.]
MQKKQPVVSEDIARFHQVVQNGSVLDLKAELDTDIDVNSPGRFEETALMVAIAANDLEKVKLLIQHGADPALTDKFNSTALGHAVSHDFADGVKLLLGLGVDRGYHPKYPLKQIEYDLESLNALEIPMPRELTEIMSEDEWNESVKDGNRLAAEMGQNPTVEPLISEVQSVEVLELFLDAGDHLEQASNELKREFTGLETDETFRALPADYRSYKSPRFGTQNPELMDNPFWSDMIRIGCNAYVARQHFDDSDAFTTPGAVWCYDRFGSSLTRLEDGRFVQIGGEHEDHYDPDFFIYNDVVIHDGKGAFQIFGYPKAVFPPTDFHSATLVGDAIYIIGCLGYSDQRKVGTIPVYRLSTDSWKIESVETSGETPSWLHSHRARYDALKNVIRISSGELLVAGEDDDGMLVPNEEQFELELGTLRWKKRR